MYWSIAVAALVIIAISSIVAFLSGMATRKRIATNILIIALAVSITYSIATFAKSVLGIEI
jgi:hypothetical protein